MKKTKHQNMLDFMKNIFPKVDSALILRLLASAGFVRTKNPKKLKPNEIVKLVRDVIGPVAAFKRVIVVQRLPKTRSGKILRGTMRSMADGKDWVMPATIDDPAILDEISSVLKARGMAGVS